MASGAPQNESVGKYIRLTGAQRKEVREHIADLYVNRGMSIREIGDEVGRSYGAVHALLTEAEVRFRPRGNPAG